MWPTLIPILAQLLEKILPDPAAAADAKLKLLELAQSGELAKLEADKAITLAQIDVNKADAAGASWLQRNWRPFIGWVCGFALAWDTILRPMLTYGYTMATGHAVPPMPTLSSEQLYSLLFGLLGLGGYRTFEKVKGAA